MRKKFENLEHKADLKIRVYGRDKKELFLNAMLAMESLLKPEYQNQKIKRNIKIQSQDLESLLVAFLSEINYLNEVEKEVYHNLKFIRFSDQEIKGVLSGQKVKDFGLIIKGITYHDLQIKKIGDKTWQAILLFDI